MKRGTGTPQGTNPPTIGELICYVKKRHAREVEYRVTRPRGDGEENGRALSTGSN